MFKSKHYPTFIYLSIIVVLLIITFNFMDILQKSNNKLTGYSISEGSVSSPKNYSLKTISNQERKNSQMPGYIYNSMLIMLFLIITSLLIRFIYKIQIQNIR